VCTQLVVVYVYVSTSVSVFVSMQMLVKDLEQMFNRPSLEIHALLVWRHYVGLLGTVSCYNFCDLCLYFSH